MNKIKIMHLIHGLNTGGAETLTKSYMLNFNRERYDVVLLCINHDKESPYEEELSRAGVNVIYAQDYLLLRGKNGFFAKTINYPCKFLIVKWIIWKERPDILHVHLHANSFVKRARLNKNISLFYTVHSEPRVLWSNNDTRKRNDFWAAKWLTRHRGMRFIVLHEKMGAEINKLFGVTDSIILNNGVDVDRIEHARLTKEVRMELNIPESAFVLGHVGRFSEVKNHTFLVDVFIDTYGKNKNAFLLMIGDGPDKNKIIERLDKNGLKGKYLILSNRDDIPDLLSAMDVFVFPSLYEGLPLSLIEAQVAKKICFVSDSVNGHASISNLVTRLSLDDGAEKWADAILSYKKPKKIVVNDEDWDIKKITKKLEQIYLDALAERRNGKK